MSVRILDAVWRHAEAKGSPLLVLLSIADNADEVTGEAWPGYDYLAAKTRLSKRAVQYCVKQLLETGELQLVRRGAKGRPNLYRIPMQTLHGKPDVIRRKPEQDSTQPVATEPSVEPSGTSSAVTEEDAPLSYLLAALMRENGCRPGAAIVTPEWAKQERLLLERDEVDREEAEAVLRWCQADDFWKANVLSMPKFRKQYDKLRLRWEAEQPTVAVSTGFEDWGQN